VRGGLANERDLEKKPVPMNCPTGRGEAMRTCWPLKLNGGRGALSNNRRVKELAFAGGICRKVYCGVDFLGKRGGKVLLSEVIYAETEEKNRAIQGRGLGLNCAAYWFPLGNNDDTKHQTQKTINQQKRKNKEQIRPNRTTLRHKKTPRRKGRRIK